MKKYKLLTFSVTLISIIFILSGCGKKTYPVGTPKNPYKIVWYQFGMPQKDLPMVEKKANEYLRKKLGVILDIHMIQPGQYTKKINVIEISGEKFDLCFTSSWTNNYVRNANRGAFYPLDKLLKKYGQGIIRELNPYYLVGMRVNGNIYAVPTNKEISSQLNYIFNEKLLKKNGFSLKDFKPAAGPETLKSLFPYFASVKKNEPGIVPINVDKNEDVSSNKFAYLMGGSSMPGAVRIGKGNYKVINQLDSKEYIAYYKLMHKMYQMGYIQKDAPEITNGYSLVATEKTAVSSNFYQPGADNVWSNLYGYKMVSIPAYKPVISDVTGASIAISINAERPDLDMKFLNLLNTDKYLRNLLQYGIDGVHYKKIGPNRIKFLPAHKSYLMFSFTLGNLYLTYLLPGDPANKWEQFKKFNASGTPSQILGFHFDPTPVSSELAAISNVKAQYKTGLTTGQMDYKTYLPKYMAALKRAGLKTYLAEEQKQLNEWAKKNKNIAEEVKTVKEEFLND
ncbi:MAG: ABC transporter substrate-binding protein [bacterium]|nr:ABC transporter substrate-binding protein [bacterium]